MFKSPFKNVCHLFLQIYYVNKKQCKRCKVSDSGNRKIEVRKTFKITNIKKKNMNKIGICQKLKNSIQYYTLLNITKIKKSDGNQEK